MNLGKLFVLLVLGVGFAAAQVDIDTTTPEGQLLQQIGGEKNATQKAALLEQFLKTYPDHKAVKWVLAQLPPVYAELKQPEKSLSWCEKLMVKDPANAPAAHACLKTAEAQKDPALVKKWALLTHAAAKKVTGAPKPKFEYVEDEEEWKQSVDFAKQVGEYSEWSLYNAALQTPDPAAKLDLVNALREANPNNEHLGQLNTQVLLALRQAGKVDQAAAMVERLDAAGKADEDMLLVAANYYFNQKKDAAKAVSYSQRVVTLLEPKGPPEGMDPAAWDTKKKNSLGLAYWIIGVTASTQKKYATADKTLRKALPNVKSNPQLLAGTLFHLGLANYQMGAKSTSPKQLLAARNYFKRCAGINSPFRAQALKNLKVLESQYRFR